LIPVAINLYPLMAKIILRFNPFSKLIVVCRGYNDDLDNFTELVWKDDKYLDFSDRVDYPQFQLWWMP
jgi:hypothetical protein